MGHVPASAGFAWPTVRSTSPFATAASWVSRAIAAARPTTATPVRRDARLPNSTMIPAACCGRSNAAAMASPRSRRARQSTKSRQSSGRSSTGTGRTPSPIISARAWSRTRPGRASAIPSSARSARRCCSRRQASTNRLRTSRRRCMATGWPARTASRMPTHGCWSAAIRSSPSRTAHRPTIRRSG